MPEKKAKESPEAQIERFQAEVARMIAAGELNPIEADGALEELMKKDTVRSYKLSTRTIGR